MGKHNIKEYMTCLTHYSLFDPSGQDTLRQASAANGTVEFIVMVVKLIRRTLAVKGGLVEVDKDLMFLLFGERARGLADKSVFPHLVRSIGYQSPDTVLIRVSSDPRQRVNAVREFFADKKINALFCKPLHGTWQRDLKILNFSEPALEKHLGEVIEDTVVQEYLPHEKTLRYTRYRDREGRVFVACFEFKEKEPAQREKRHIPLLGQRISFPKMGVSLDGFMHTESDLYAVPLGNAAHQQEHLGRFMDTFSEKLEETIGGVLPLLSVDIGVRKLRDLEGEYDEGRMRNNIVFFETQTIPHPWRLLGESYVHMLKAYRHLWRLFFAEHGKEIKRRLQSLEPNTHGAVK